jgi:uncharacterized protein YbjT (DUF2867 family)
MQKVLIAGATGVLGRAIDKSAIGAGFAVRQGVRSPAKANPKAEAVHFDYADPSTISSALEANAPALLGPVVTAAKLVGVRHIVLISAVGVNHHDQAPKHIVEHLVHDSGVPYTILRSNLFMENSSDGFLKPSIREQNAVYLAAGDRKTSFISVEDIAAVVVAALPQSLTGKEIDLTGPEATTFRSQRSSAKRRAARSRIIH